MLITLRRYLREDCTAEGRSNKDRISKVLFRMSHNLHEQPANIAKTFATRYCYVLTLVTAKRLSRNHFLVSRQDSK